MSTPQADHDRIRTNSASVYLSRAVQRNSNNKCKMRLKTIACRHRTRTTDLSPFLDRRYATHEEYPARFASTVFSHVLLLPLHSTATVNHISDAQVQRQETDHSAADSYTLHLHLSKPILWLVHIRQKLLNSISCNQDNEDIAVFTLTDKLEDKIQSVPVITKNPSRKPFSSLLLF